MRSFGLQSSLRFSSFVALAKDEKLLEYTKVYYLKKAAKEVAAFFISYKFQTFLVFLRAQKITLPDENKTILEDCISTCMLLSKRDDKLRTNKKTIYH